MKAAETARNMAARTFGLVYVRRDLGDPSVSISPAVPKGIAGEWALGQRLPLAQCHLGRLVR